MKPYVHPRPRVRPAEAPAPAAAQGPEAVFRPLLLASAGLGVMVLGLLQFAAEALPALPEQGRALVARGIRTAFFGFLGTAAALLIAYLTRAWRSERLVLAFNLHGVVAFVAGSVVVGGQIGAALTLLAPEDGSVPATVAFFFLFNSVAVAALALAAVARPILRPAARQEPRAMLARKRLLTVAGVILFGILFAILYPYLKDFGAELRKASS